MHSSQRGPVRRGALPFRRPVSAAVVGFLVVLGTFYALYGASNQASATATDPVVATVGDIACDPANSGFNGGNGDAADCQQKATANLLSAGGAIGPVDAVLPLGDEQYNCGGLTAFNQVYKPTWGSEDSISHPVPGNHEYQNSGGTGCPTAHNASGYFSYFGAQAGDPSKGYYSFNLGAWHIIALNSELCYGQAPYNQSPITPGCQAGSPEETWLKSDLAANHTACTLAYWHEPRFYSLGGGSDDTLDAFWQDLYAAHADVVLGGHQHFYERFALQNPSGQADANGIREFVVGTGGESLMALSNPRRANSQASASTFGVLKLALHSSSYDWRFYPTSGTFTDSGTTSCHGTPPTDTTPPTTTISCNTTACGSGWYNAPVSVSLSASDSGSGVSTTRYTTDGSDPTTSSTAKTYSGPFTLSSTGTVKYYSMDNSNNVEAVHSQQVRIDNIAPVTAITCNGASCSGSYTGSVSVALAATDGGGSGVSTTRYTTDGSDPATSATAKTYSGAFSVTTTTTVRYGSTDVAGNVEASHSQTVSITSVSGDTTAPTTTIACNGAPCPSGWFGPAPVTITLAATDSGGSGVAGTVYTTDGSDPSSSATAQPYTAPFSVATTSRIRFFSTDNSNNAEAPQSQLVQVDTAAPTTKINCNAAGCGSWFTASPVTVALTAADGGQSGVAGTFYTTDGSDPSTSSTAVSYTAPFSVSATTQVRFYSRDNVGNAETPKSQNVRIDTIAPSTAMNCGTAGDPCGTSPYSGSVLVALVASDAGGSGVASTVYTTDGSDPTTSATALAYTAPFSISSTTTIKAFSTDVAGNVESTATQVIQVSGGGAPGSASFTPTDDSYTSAANPTGTHGSEKSLNVNSGSSERRTYLKFSVTGIPSGATNVKATLNIYSQSSAASTITFTASKVATGWSEGAITWNNQPALGSVVTTRAGLTTSVYNTFDLSSLITMNGTYAIAITSNNTTQRYFNSKETAANPPQLVVTWNS